MNYPLSAIEGLTPADAARLKAAGIRTAAKLLEAAASARGRQALACKTGISEQQLLEWANFVDFMRVKGLGRAKGEILRASGVKTLRTLTQRNPARLAEKMQDVNERRRLVRGTITAQSVEQLITRARDLPFKITY